MRTCIVCSVILFVCFFVPELFLISCGVIFENEALLAFLVDVNKV